MKKLLLFSVVASLLVFTACKKEFTITVKSNNDEWGSVNGGGTYTKGTTVSIEAIAKDGYKFVKWEDGNTNNPRNITVESAVSYTAVFEKNTNGGGGSTPEEGELPTITTRAVSDITNSTALCGGIITSEGGSPITARGVCWADFTGPDINDSHTNDGTGVANYTSTITGLAGNKTYYVRAYATNSAGTAYGDYVMFTTSAVATNYPFSVNASQKVVFSPGNLQYRASTNTWRFAPNQWDTIGANNKNISSTYSGWIDVFGWGTSGYDNKYPYMTSETNTDYGNGNNNISGTNYDWGVYNAIYNPKTNKTDVADSWRTLKQNEWLYLLNTRYTPSGIRYAKAIVNGVKGLILVPDNWSTSTYALNQTNTANADYTSNTISNWTILENSGCVFLPAAGYRNGTSYFNTGHTDGYYWAATYSNSSVAQNLYFYESGLRPSDSHQRHYGYSVRLVRAAL